jgi:hypothetical protein
VPHISRFCEMWEMKPLSTGRPTLCHPGVAE